MTTLRIGLLLILLAGSAAAQVSTTTSHAPDLTVLKTSWRRVEPSRFLLTEAPSSTSVDNRARMAVNAARTNEANSRRQMGESVPPPRLLSIPSTSDFQPPPVRPWSGFLYEFTVKNTGAKVIRQVVLEYSFTDPSTQKTVGRRQFKSKVKIRPGVTAKLVVRSSRRPLGTIDATRGGETQLDPSREQVVIQKIKYADGSVWERSATSPNAKQ